MMATFADSPMKSILFVILFMKTLHISASSSLAPALYVFGDSLFDSGNNNLLPTIAKANYLPYGVDFAKGFTGRFTNGKTVADFIAEYLRLPYAPPVLSIKALSAPMTGLNYASGSCGILPETGRQLGKCLNIEDQINLFSTTVEKELRGRFKNSNDELSEYLSKSIFIFSIGNNDYINNYLRSGSSTSKSYSPQAFAQLLVDKLALQLQRLYKLGARKVVVFELGPIGCLPSVTRKANGGTQCVEEVNDMVSFFNDGVGPMLDHLTFTLQDSIFVLGHAHWLGYDAIQNPSKYGLTNTMSPCCKTWMNGTSGCIPFLKSCGGPNTHFFWDAFHLTESVCSLIASRCSDDPSVCSPPLAHLVQM